MEHSKGPLKHSCVYQNVTHWDREGMILLNKHLHRNMRLSSQNQTKLHSRYSLVMLLMSCLLLVACNPGDLGRAVTGWTPIAFDTETSMLFSVDQDGYVKALKDNGYDGLSASWKYPPNKEDRLIGSFHPPVIHGESIFLTGANGHTYSINKSNGSLQDGGWRAPETLGVELPRLYSGIAIDEINNVGFVPDETGTLQGYKLETGKPLDWNFTAEAGIWGTPVIDENRIYFGSHDKNFYSIDIVTGELDWSFSANGAIVSQPALSEELVIFGSFDRTLYAVDKYSGTLRWSFEGANWFWAPPLINGTTIYAASMNGVLHALDHNGNHLWEYDHKEPIVSSPLMTDSGIVIVSTDGKLTLLDSTPQDIGESREKSSLELGDKNIKSPMLRHEEYVYVSSQNDKIRKLRVSSAGFNQIWCYDLEEEQFCD